MHIDILTLFPEMFTSYTNESILKRAQEAGHLALRWHNIRDYATGKHRVTDEPPYGGGGGMILKPEPIFRAVEALLQGSGGAGEQGSGGAEEQGSGGAKENVSPLAPHPSLFASRSSPIILM
jgi:tRNA (guanine37-N1)-methyltransferase